MARPSTRTFKLDLNNFEFFEHPMTTGLSPWPDKQCLITATSQRSIPLNIHGHIVTTLGLILHQPHGFTTCLQTAGLHTDFLRKVVQTVAYRVVCISKTKPDNI